MYRYFKFMLVASVALLVAAGTGSAKVFVVDKDGTSPTYKTLAGALASAAIDTNGPHQIVILPGEYDDYGLSVPTGALNSVDAIYGHPDSARADIIFHAPAAQFQAVDFLSIDGSNGLVIEHFTVKDYVWAIFATGGSGVDDVEIRDMEFDNNGEDGAGTDGAAIRLMDSDDGTFENLYIHDGERGILLQDFASDPSVGNTVQNCVIDPMEFYGIRILGAGSNTINDNEIVDCAREAIWLTGAVGGTIQGNKVYNNASDAASTSHAGIYLDVTSGVTVRNNVCYNNGDATTGYGVYVASGGDYTYVYDNCFWGHVGNQGYEVAAVTGYWARNYYGDLAAGATNYPVEGGVETDYSPVMRDNSPVAQVSDTMEVWSSQTIDFMWTLPSTCDPYDSVPFAFYDFTVTFDTNLIKVIDSTDYDNDEFFGPLNPAFYIKGGDWKGGTLTFAGMNMGDPNYDAGLLAWALFQAVGVGTDTITISSTYRDTLGNDIPVSSTALTLTLVDTETPTIVIYENDPLDIDTYSEPAGDDIELHIDGAVTDNFDLKDVHYRFDDAGSYMKIQDVFGMSDTIIDYQMDHTLSAFWLGICPSIETPSTTPSPLIALVRH